MTITKQVAVLVSIVVILLGLAGYNFMSAQVWSSPTATPPLVNVPAPINVGVSAATVQNGDGALFFDRFAASDAVWSNQYCDALGANCWDPTTGPPGGGGDDTITVGGRCFEPAWAVGCMWNWSGDGNDTATYIRPLSSNPGAVCGSVGRAYMYHSMILAECMTPVYRWVASGWSCNAPWPPQCSTTRGTNVRTVSCQDQFGTVVAGSNCTGVPPTTTGTSCTRRGGGSDC